jgi:hypothetical protein
MAPLLLRKIEKNRWMKMPYVPAGDVPADALRDLQTGSNNLSVWHVEEDSSNLERIVLAIAATRDAVTNLDYALFGYEVLAETNIKIKSSVGNSPDEIANATWHRDLTELSVSQIANLAKAIDLKGERNRVSERKVLQGIKKALAGGHIHPEKLKQNVSTKVREPG